MMRPLLVLLAVSIAAPVAACHFGDGDHDDGPGVAASGTGTTRSYAVNGFRGVELRGSDDVDVSVGPAFSIRAEGPADQLDQLRIAKEGDTLQIGRRRGFHWTPNAGKVRVFVTMPAIDAASVAGSATLSIDRVTGARFAGSVAGSGDLLVRAIRVEQANFGLAGSGTATAAGNVGRLDIGVQGSGELKAPGLTARNATVSIAGSGSVHTMVDGAATISMMGSGDVDLGPKARCQTTKMGSGSVRCGG